jgi:hypothetical protein
LQLDPWEELHPGDINFLQDESKILPAMLKFHKTVFTKMASPWADTAKSIQRHQQ